MPPQGPCVPTEQVSHALKGSDLSNSLLSQSASGGVRAAALGLENHAKQPGTLVQHNLTVRRQKPDEVQAIDPN